jgi:signal transduction histidine kinase
MARRNHRTPTEHTILVVDDQEETVVSVRKLLEREGHKVLTADSGEQALTVLRQTDIHLLLVDYFMPRMTGEQLVREVRAFDPFVQIILQTGYSGEMPPRMMLGDLDIQGYHDKADGPERLLVWVDVGLKAHCLISSLRERERLQKELVANVSHELRTPLNVITGYAELLLEGDFGELPKSSLRPLRKMTEAAVNLSELVSDFLKYAKVEAGMLDIAERRIPTADLTHEMERLATLLLDEKEVDFKLEIDAAPAALHTDPIKLRTILRNLVTNAAKFTIAGEIRLSIVRHDDTLCFMVVDTGPGIRAEDRELIFEPFRQGDGSSTREHRGIGLGLALSRKLARILGGTLDVKSEPGVGSTFTLALPSEVGVDERPAEKERRVAAPVEGSPA